MTSVKKSYISKSAKKIETITCTNVLKYILTLDEKSEKNSFLLTLRHYRVKRGIEWKVESYRGF